MVMFFACWGKIFLCGPHLDEAQLKAQLKQCVAPSFDLVLGMQLRSVMAGRAGVPLMALLRNVSARRSGGDVHSILWPSFCIQQTHRVWEIISWSRCFFGRQTCWGWSLQRSVPRWGLQSGGNRARRSSGRTIFGPYYQKWGVREPIPNDRFPAFVFSHCRRLVHIALALGIKLWRPSTA